MWFNNAKVFTFTERVGFTEQELIAALEKMPARECQFSEVKSFGWTTPFGDESDLIVESAAGYWLIAMKVHERVLPGPVVKAEVDAKVKEIRAKEDRRVAKRERDQIKDEVTDALLPRAFIRSSVIHALIAPSEGWIAINASTSAKAEDLLNLLRESLGSLPVRPLSVALAPMQTMTAWVTEGRAAPQFVIGDRCTLVDLDGEGGRVVCRGQDLAGDDIQQLISSGKAVKQLALEWDEKLAFMLDDGLGFKGIKYKAVLEEQAYDDADGGGKLAHQQASMVIMAGALSGMFKAVVDGLGGQQETSKAA